MKTALYILACLTIPALWGLVASWIYDRIMFRSSERHGDGKPGADMYHI